MKLHIMQVSWVCACFLQRKDYLSEKSEAVRIQVSLSILLQLLSAAGIDSIHGPFK
jgi:hypothetical protein